MCNLLKMRKGIRVQKKYWEYFIVLNIFCGCLIYVIYNIGTRNINSKENSQSRRSRRPFSDYYFSAYTNRKRNLSNWTRILFWTGYFNNYEFNAFGIDQETFKNCQVKCQLTFDRRLLSLSDAVVFHIRDVGRVGLPTYHSPHQIWIFYMLESADNTRLDLRSYVNVFNWTMTYRRDSDIYHPYGRVVQKITSQTISSVHRTIKFRKKYLTQKFYSKKSNLIAWVVSNCFTHSNRESLVFELENYIPVHKYGYCGHLTCVGETTAECYAHLAKSYKFYLAFENSLCVDYVTEKFFECLNYDMVPIVYGRVNYSTIAPPGSYIDSRNFQSPEALAQYLIYLNRHPQEYSKYFRWKENYRILPSDGWCTLCTKLNRNIGAKSYFNIWKWWTTASKEHIQDADSMISRQENLNKENENRNQGTRACLPIPEFSNESWFSKIRKKYFILPFD